MLSIVGVPMGRDDVEDGTSSDDLRFNYMQITQNNHTYVNTYHLRSMHIQAHQVASRCLVEAKY